MKKNMERETEVLDIKVKPSEVKPSEQVTSLGQENRNDFSVANSESTIPYIRRCGNCKMIINSDCYISWELMDFCTDLCILKIQGADLKCARCYQFIASSNFGKYYLRKKNNFKLFCAKNCLESYKSLVKICSYCQKDISGSFSLQPHPEFSLNRVLFCSQICYETFNSILTNDLPKVPSGSQCVVCEQNKSLTIVLKHKGSNIFFCTKNCLIAYSFVNLHNKTEKCVLCQSYFTEASFEGCTVFHENVQLTFCSLCCQNWYILLHSKVVSCAWCQNKRYNFGMIRKYSEKFSPLDIALCSINCLRLYEASVINNTSVSTRTQDLHQSRSLLDVSSSTLSARQTPNQNITTLKMSNVLPSSNTIRVNENLIEFTDRSCLVPIQNKHQFVVQTAKYIQQRNVATMCYIPKAEKSILARPITLNKSNQTEKLMSKKIFLPVPVPIYVPSPMAMFSVPVLTAIPFPIPVPVPVFVPITQKLAEGITTEIKQIETTIPSNPYEAEILQIADIINVTKLSRSLKETGLEIDQNLNSNAYSLENEITNVDIKLDIKKGRKRCTRSSSVENGAKKRLPSHQKDDLQIFKLTNKKSLDSTLAVTAWKQWLMRKNKFLRKQSKNTKILKSDILQMSSEELGNALYLFIKEFRKPNDSEYAPDTIYYLCLGIQRYLSENGRTDNIFFDQMCSSFIDGFDQIACKFGSIYENECQYIVTRIEEEHLWEAKQLGSNSPQILLNTLIFFNTKYYYCSTVKQHMDIAFFQILKMWKKSKSKCMMLRYYPKRSKNGMKHMGEQYQNINDDSRCPVRLYEFYLSKCPGSAKAKHDLFYLQPEKYCTSDSPLWYTMSPLQEETLAKMFNRIKMVKEINIALGNK